MRHLPEGRTVAEKQQSSKRVGEGGNFVSLTLPKPRKPSLGRLDASLAYDRLRSIQVPTYPYDRALETILGALWGIKGVVLADMIVECGGRRYSNKHTPRMARALAKLLLDQAGVEAPRHKWRVFGGFRRE